MKKTLYVVRQPGNRWHVHVFTEPPQRYTGYDDNGGVRSFVRKFGLKRSYGWFQGEPECRSSLRALGLGVLADMPHDTVVRVHMNVGRMETIIEEPQT